MPSHPPTHTHILTSGLLLCAMLPLLIACGAAAPAAPATAPPVASPTAAPATAPPSPAAPTPPIAAPTVPPTAAPATELPPTIPATGPPIGTPALARVITNADGGGQFTFAVGQKFSLQLSARRWSQPVVDPRMVRALPVPTPAAPDVNRWDYQAVAPGRTDLTTEGACLPALPGGVTCMSIELYKITIIVTP